MELAVYAQTCTPTALNPDFDHVSAKSFFTRSRFPGPDFLSPAPASPVALRLD
jgi:hypothetical protein